MTERTEVKTLEHYLSLDYPITIYRATEGGYVAEIEDLPGCITQGDTLEEVSQNIEEARRGWIETTYEDGMEIPLPRTETEYSGRFVVRIPRSLHKQLAKQAAREGVSLNQYVETVLSKALGRREATDELREELQRVILNQRGKTIWFTTNWVFGQTLPVETERPLGIQPSRISTREKLAA